MMKMRVWGIGIVLVFLSAASIACVTYSYPPTAYNGPVAPAVAPPGGSDQPFYDDLAPYGRWVFVAGPGWVWSPNDMQADWRPYQLGHWVFTDAGWTWASDEQWGSVVYHYGRWNQDPTYGWIWVPGTEWGPAWVAWNEGGGYVGWAPLPWNVRIQAGVGIDWAGLNISISPASWCFVSARHLVDPGLRNVIVPPARNVTLIQVTKNVTNYTYIDNRVVNHGVKVEGIGRAVGHTIPRYRISETDSPEVTRGGKVRGQDFVVFKPHPVRGSKSQGRLLPPGRDDARQTREFRQVPTQPDSVPAVTGPDAPPATTQADPNTAPPARIPSNPPPRSRGRSFLENLTRQHPPRPSPPGHAPAQTAEPGQPPAATPPAAAPPASEPGSVNAGSANPAPADQQSVTTPPANQAPPKGQPTRPNGRENKKHPPKGGKPKTDVQKADGSDTDKPKS
jgi:hypothetical protein